jgi:hypothetical protein
MTKNSYILCFIFKKKINEKFSYFGPQLLTPMSMGILLKSSSKLCHFFTTLYDIFLNDYHTCITMAKSVYYIYIYIYILKWLNLSPQTLMTKKSQFCVL